MLYRMRLGNPLAVLSIMADGAAAQPSKKVRVLIADDHAVIRGVVREALKARADFEVCGEAENGREAVEEAKKLKPDVVVLNITMPILNGFEAAREIKAVLPEAAIVILSSHTDKHFIEVAKTIGAQAYVAKSQAREQLVKAVESALLGKDFVLME
jgi:two-component system, NarL family, response regulator NreC